MARAADEPRLDSPMRRRKTDHTCPLHPKAMVLQVVGGPGHHFELCNSCIDEIGDSGTACVRVRRS